MSTMATRSEIWDDILKGNVGKDDPLWEEYIGKTDVFDVRMADELNKIVDVFLVYVALFISFVTPFIVQTSTQFQRNPADITNDLLVAIYNQLAAQSNNTSTTPVDPRSYFNQSKEDYNTAVLQNALLYTSLSLAIIVSMIALVAKLWLYRTFSYSRRASSFGLPYERAMKRQEAFNGVLVWKLEGVINFLPALLLVALNLFVVYLAISISAVQDLIGFIVVLFLNEGGMFLGYTSLGGAFISGCPFRSPISDVIRIIFKSFGALIPRRFLQPKSLTWRIRWGLIVLFALTGASICSFIVIYTSITGPLFTLVVFPAIPIVYSLQQEAVHKPQKYKISHLALWASIPVSLLMSLAVWFGGPVFAALYLVGMLGTIGACWVVIKMSKSMADTGEIDAIAWLLHTTPQHPAKFFKKAYQMTGSDSIGRYYRPRLLESLMPILTSLITSYHTPQHHTSETHSPSSKPRRNFKIELKREQSDDALEGRYGLPTSLNLVYDDTGPSDEDPNLENLEFYIACLARFSDFTDCKGSFWCLWEDAMQHPKLEQQLIDKLVVLANPRYEFQDYLRTTATKILNNYGLDMEGKPVRSPATVVRRDGNELKSAASLVSNVNSQQEQEHPNLHRPAELTTRVEPPHSFVEIEEA